MFIAAVVVSTVSGLSRTLFAQTADLDPRIVKLVGEISEERLSNIERKLQSFETRSTLSSTTSTTRGIGAARTWILNEMQSYSPRLNVSFDTYMVAKQGRITREVELRNVMAVLPGRSPRRIYVSGHYDTVARRGVRARRTPAAHRSIRMREPRRPSIRTHRSTTWRPASTTTAAARR